MAWCRGTCNIYKTVDAHWNKVIFSDECKVILGQDIQYLGAFYVVDWDINEETYISVLGDNLWHVILHTYNILRMTTSFFRTTMRLYIGLALPRISAELINWSPWSCQPKAPTSILLNCWWRLKGEVQKWASNFSKVHKL